MAQYIDKDTLVAEIKRMMAEEMALFEESLKDDSHEISAAPVVYTRLQMLLSSINTLEVKEVDLDLITGWFDHITQIADDRMTLTNQRMTDTHALDEIKCLAKNSSEFITRHYKAQKGK